MTPSNVPQHPVPGPDDADEVDPTGIRDLLRALPDPGPMPDDLVRRIETRLAVELAHRSPSHPFTEEPVDPHGGRVVDLGSERARRRPGRTVVMLGVAAAGLLVTTVAVGDLLGSGVVGGADTAAYAPASEEAARDDAAGGAADEQVGEDGQAGGAGENAEGDSDATEDSAGGAAAPDQAAADSSAEVVVLADLGEVDEASFAEEVALVGAPASGSPGSPSLSAAQAKSCWSAIPDSDGWAVRHAASATLEEDPVVLLWAHRSDGRRHAWLVPAECMVNPAVTPIADAAVSP